MDLSVVIPAYNEEKRLPETLFSIGEYLRSRDSLQAEVIVVSDGSTDQTVAVVEQFGAQFQGAFLSKKQGQGLRAEAWSPEQ